MFGITPMLIKSQARSILTNKVNKLLKFIYYNAFFALAWWLLAYIYKINIWLVAVASVLIIYLFIKITSKFLNYIK